MDKSKKDEIILRQLEVIRSMTEHNLSRMGTDFWGTPATGKPVPAAPAPEKEKRPRRQTAGRKRRQRRQNRNMKTPPKLRPRRTSRTFRRSWTATWASLR